MRPLTKPKPARERFEFLPDVLLEPARLMVEAWQGEQYLFADPGQRILPQARIFDLPLDPESMVEVLFYLTITTVFGSRTDLLYARVAEKLGENHGFLRYFSTDFLAEVDDPEPVAEALKSLGISSGNVMAARFLRTARYLRGECQGNPIQLFRECQNIDQLLKRHTRRYGGRDKLYRICGWQGKTASLFAIYLAQLGMLPEGFCDYYTVDIWTARFARQMGALTGQGTIMLMTMEAVIRQGIYRLCQQHGLPLLELNCAMWRLGTTACFRCYKSGKFPRTAVCPVERLCRGIGRTRVEDSSGGAGKIDFDAKLKPQKGRAQLGLHMP